MVHFYTNAADEIILNDEGDIMTGPTADDCCCVELVSYVAEHCVDGTFATVNGDVEVGDVVSDTVDCWTIISPTTHNPAAPTVTATPGATCNSCLGVATCGELLAYINANATSVTVTAPPMTAADCEACPSVYTTTGQITDADFAVGGIYTNFGYEVESAPTHIPICNNIVDFEPGRNESTDLSINITCAGDNITILAIHRHSWQNGLAVRDQECHFRTTIPWQTLSLLDLASFQLPLVLQQSNGAGTASCNCGISPLTIEYTF